MRLNDPTARAAMLRADTVLPFQLTGADSDGVRAMLDVCTDIERLHGGKCSVDLVRSRDGSYQALVFRHRPAVAPVHDVDCAEAEAQDHAELFGGA